jgi:hypothetical protein
VTSIPPLDRLVRSLEGQVVRAADRLSAQPPPAAKASNTRGIANKSQAGSFLASKIREIRPDDPRRRQRAFRAFLEGALVELFGPEATADARFQRVIDQVESALDSRPEFSRAAQRVAEILLSAEALDNGTLAGLAQDVYRRAAPVKLR